MNSAVHDGATMFGRERTDHEYRVWGWSFRMLPPDVDVQGKPNKGSAYHSCLAMSCVETVDCVYFFSPQDCVRFEQGRAIHEMGR